MAVPAARRGYRYSVPPTGRHPTRDAGLRPDHRPRPTRTTANACDPARAEQGRRLGSVEGAWLSPRRVSVRGLCIAVGRALDAYDHGAPRRIASGCAPARRDVTNIR